MQRFKAAIFRNEKMYFEPYNLTVCESQIVDGFVNGNICLWTSPLLKNNNNKKKQTHHRQSLSQSLYLLFHHLSWTKICPFELFKVQIQPSPQRGHFIFVLVENHRLLFQPLYSQLQSVLKHRALKYQQDKLFRINTTRTKIPLVVRLRKQWATGIWFPLKKTWEKTFEKKQSTGCLIKCEVGAPYHTHFEAFHTISIQAQFLKLCNVYRFNEQIANHCGFINWRKWFQKL